MIKVILIRMTFFLSLGALTALTMVLLLLVIMPGQPPVVSVEVSPPDRLTLPVERQSVETGAYRLEIVGAPKWRSALPTATLYNGDVLVWEKTLPQQYGPRFVLVSTEGYVVLFDEFINVASPYAIALISPTGKEISTYSFDNIQEFLQDISRADLTRQATSGWWISSPPQLDETEQNARVQTGGTTLQIDLITGELRRRNDL